MAASTEQITIWILEALKAEWDREPDFLMCRTDAVVLGEVMAAHSLENADIDRGLRFLLSIRGIKAVNRDDGRATLPSIEGLQYLSAHQAAQKREVERKQDVRLKIYPIIIAILAVLVAYLGYKLWK